MRSALLIVDVQRDFCPGGALPAEGCPQILPVLNRYLADARARGIAVYASRDWHPPVTTHFQAYGGPWPPHCVQGSEGAAFHLDLELPPDAIVVTKGDAPDRPGYSAFEGLTSGGAPLGDDLRTRGVERLYVAGLTTEYCVKATALDGARAGLEVHVLPDAIAGIDTRPGGDADRAVSEMIGAGVELTPGFGDWSTPTPRA